MVRELQKRKFEWVLEDYSLLLEGYCRQGKQHVLGMELYPPPGTPTPAKITCSFPPQPSRAQAGFELDPEGQRHVPGVRGDSNPLPSRETSSVQLLSDV